MQKSGAVWQNNLCTFFDPHVCASNLFPVPRELGHNQQALYCYGKVYNLDPSMLNALWDRATLAKEIGELKIVCDLHPFLTCSDCGPVG